MSDSGSDLTKDADYTVDPSSVFSATGSARSNETYKVIINAVDGSDYIGSATNEWKILAPSGEFAADALSTTTEGCTVNGTKLTVTDSAKLIYADGKWAMSLTAELTHSTTVINPSPLVHFADVARGLAFTAEEAEEGSDLISITGGKTKIVSGNYKGKTDVQKFTWTESFSLEEIEAAKSSGVLRRTLTVYEVAYSEWVVVTLSNNGGLRETTLVMEIPIDEKLVLLDQYGNQMYPALPYVVENTTTHKKYLSLTNALEASEANQTNILIASGEKADFTIPQDVTVNLEGFGNGEATYLLDVADNALGATLVSSNAEEVATQKGFEIVTNFKNDVYTYTLQKGHIHAWGNFNAEGNVLTATCTNYEKDCTIADRTITLTLMAEDKEYDGKAPNAGFDKDEKALFEELLSEDPQHMLSIGEVGYTRPDYSAGKWYAGKYTAFVTVQIEGVDYKLEKEFSITKPQGGYTDGFEAAVGGYDVRFNTFAEAASVATNNATVCYRGGNLNQKTIYFSSDKDITLDLGGKTLTYEKNEKMTIRNDGTGKVTFVNGTIKQPKGLAIANHIALTGSNGGSMAFGDDIDFLNTATSSDNYLTVTVDGISVEIVNGKYQAAFKTENAGSLLVKGGNFAKNPEALLADGYALGKQQIEGYKFHVFKHTHSFSYTADGNCIYMHCGGEGHENCYYDGLKITLVAEDVTYDGNPHPATLECDEGIPAGIINTKIFYYTNNVPMTGVPTEIGEYEARFSVNQATAVKTYGIEVGAIIVDGKHYSVDDAASQIEKGVFLTDMYISVGKDFNAPRAYKVPDVTAVGPTKTFDLDGYTVTAAPGEPFFINSGKLVLCDTSIGHTGRMELYPSNGDGETPLIINRAGKAVKVLDADIIESYGAELTIESGIYLGAISNEVGETVEILGESVDLSAKIVISGGKFLYRPDDAWLDDGCYIREETLDDGTPVFTVYPHQHNYKFVHVGPLVIGYCVARDEGQGILEPSSCKAKVLAMLTLMGDHKYDGEKVTYFDPEDTAIIDPDGSGAAEVSKEKVWAAIVDLFAGKFDSISEELSGVYYLNLSALFRSDIDWEALFDGDSGTILDRIKEQLGNILSGGKLENKDFLSKKQFMNLTKATVSEAYFTTDASLIDELFNDENDELLPDAPADVGKYKFCVDLTTPSTNDISAKNSFKITPVDIAETIVTLKPNTNSFICSGQEQGYDSVSLKYQVEVKALVPYTKTMNLVEGTDYELSGDWRATDIGDYKFTIKGIGNYTSSTNFNWSIVAPTREFPVDVITALDDEMNGKGSYGFVEDNTLFVSNPPAIYFDIATESWRLGFTINWPNEAGNRTKAEDAMITLPDGTECSVADLVDGIVEFEGITAEVDGDGFVKTITYQVYLTPEEVFTARDEFDGLTDFVYSFKAGAWATGDNGQGFKPTEFSLVIPLGNLELYDCNGFRVYPVHLHKWQFETVKGYILEAKCVADPEYELDCPFDGPTPTLHLGRTERDEFEYTGNRMELLLNVNEVSEFRYATGVIVGKVVYYQNGVQLPEPPINIGDYSATVTIIPMGAEPYVLTKEFTIVKPQGGYADGFEVGSTGIRYDTYAEAVATLTNNGDTVYCHQDIVKNEIDLTTPYDITLDLCGKTVTGDADMTIANNATTTIKVVNGTFEQPRHYTLYIIQSADQSEASKGSFVFGEGLRLRNVALASYNYFTVTVGKNASLRIEDGAYSAKFTGSGKIEIVGGLFWREFDPTEYVPDGYVVKGILGDFAYEVLPDTAELVQGTALPSVERLVMSMEDDSARDKVATIVGGSVDRARELKVWLEEYGLTSRDLVLSDHAKASFALGTSLIDGKEVKIRDVAMGKDGLEFRLAVADGVHTEVVRTSADRIASFLQRTADLETGFVGTVNPADLNVGADGKIIIRGEPQNGTMLIRFLAPRDR